MPPTHVPAWRRLGLKLKSEGAGGAAAAPTAVTNGGQHVSKKRKLVRSDEPELQLATPALAHYTNGVNGVATPPPTNNGALSHQRSETPSPRKRKSVTFTPETKIQDGGRDMSEFFEGSSDSESSSDGERNTSSDADSEDELRPPTKPTVATEVTSPPEPEPKPPKRAKKPKESENSDPSSLDAHESATSEYVRPQLKYLTEFSTSRATWKFNKAKQNWLLKHALDLEKIPDTYDSVLTVYMGGLENEAARSRVRAAARDRLEADDAALKKETENAAPAAALKGPTNSAEQLRQAYQRTIDAFGKRVIEDVTQGEEHELLEDSGWRARLLKRQRAQLLAWSVKDPGAELRSETLAVFEVKQAEADAQVLSTGPKLGRVSVMDKAAIAKQDATGDTGRRRRRRRRRSTGVPDDDSESSASEPDSDAAQVDAKRVASALVARPTQVLGSETSSESGEDEDDESTSADGSSGEDGPKGSKGVAQN